MNFVCARFFKCNDIRFNEIISTHLQDFMLESWSRVLFFRIALSLSPLFIHALDGNAQKLTSINQPRRGSPYVVVIYEKAQESFINKHIQNYRDTYGTSFLLVQTDVAHEVSLVTDSINGRLNRTENVDLQRCYVLVIGNLDFFRNYASIDTNGFFSQKYFLATDGSSYTSPVFEVGTIEQTSVEEIVEVFSTSYLWQLRLSQLRNAYVSDLNQNSIESGLFVRTNAVLPFYSGLEHSVKPFFRTFSFGAYHRWGRRWQSSLDFTIGLNMPSRNRIQSELQSELFSGQEVEIDIQAHVLRSVNLETRYLFLPQEKKLDPYVGVRLGLSSIRFTETTIEVDPSDLSGGGFPDQGGFDGEDFQTLSSPMVGLSSGIQFILSPKIATDVGISWNQDIASLERNEQYFNNVSLSVGFHFRFTGKKDLFYDYINSTK